MLDMFSTATIYWTGFTICFIAGLITLKIGKAGEGDLGEFAIAVILVLALSFTWGSTLIIFAAAGLLYCIKGLFK